MFIKDLWTPEHALPQLTQETVENLQNYIHQFGAIEIANGALEQLQSRQQRIGAYLDEFGFRLNALSNEDFWPAWALRLGASLAHLAYEDSGQTTTVDKTFDLSHELAEMQGIPDTYTTSMYDDQGLQAVIQTAFEDNRLQMKDGQGLLQVSIIGAGCVRFFMQAALSAA